MKAKTNIANPKVKIMETELIMLSFNSYIEAHLGPSEVRRCPLALQAERSIHYKWHLRPLSSPCFYFLPEN